jgi:hypothetical protein
MWELFQKLFGGGGNSQNGWDILKGIQSRGGDLSNANLDYLSSLNTDTGGFSMFGGDKGGGLLGGVMGGLGSLGELYGAYKQLGLMNDQLDFQKNAFDYQKGFAEREYESRRKDYNRQLEDRQKARLSADPERLQSYDSLDTYMGKHGV